MILKAFSLLDTKTGYFNTPFFMAHTGQAIRACMDLGQDLNTTVGRHPADFSLCEIGTFDDQTGILTPIPPHQLGTVAGFLPAPASSPRLFGDDFQIPAKPNGLQLGRQAGPENDANSLPS